MVRGSILAFVAFAGLPAHAQSEQAQSTVEDIVVTAQKRTENIQKVPISITAISADTIESARITSALGLSSLAPNLTVVATGVGAQTPMYTIRGVRTGGVSAGVDNGISVYIDGVYLSRLSGSIFDMADIQRIEVLKGPQGTVFGRNTTGGAISIITAQPTGKFGVKQELTVGNYRQFRSKTLINLPEVGPFAASLSYFHDERRGDTRNLGAGDERDYGPSTNGRFGKVVSPKYLGDSNTDAVQAKVKFDPGGGFDMLYKFDYTDSRYTPRAMTPLGFGVGYRSLLGQLFADQPDPSILSPITNKRPDAVNNNYATPGHIKNWGHTLTTSWRVSHAVSFKNILAYRANTIDDFNQIDGAGGLVATASFLKGLGYPAATAEALAGSPITIFGTNSLAKEHTWSEELQMNITTRWFDLTSGFYYFTDYAKTDGHGGAQVPVLQVRPGGIVLPTVADGSTFKARSMAVYSQANFHLTDQLDFVAGGRITKDIKKGIDGTNGLNMPFHYSGDKPTWMLGLNYQAAPNIMTYVKASTGYISGGRIGGQDFGPELAQSYEGGIKTDLLDRRLRANFAGFYVDYTGLQFQAVTTSGISIIQNAGKAYAWGGELEVTYVPINGLTLSGNAGYTKFKFTYIAPNLLNGRPLDQFYPNNRPELTASGSIQYVTPAPVAFGGHLMARLEGNFRTKYYLHQLLPLPSDQAKYPDQARTAHYMVSPATLLVNGRLGLNDIDIGGTKADIALWARNITNRKELISGSNLTLIQAGMFEPARTFGVDLSVAF